MPIKRYDKFAGVDYSKDKTQIDATRSPDALNIMPDSGGLPEKRVGYRKIEQVSGRINGIYSLNGELIIHAGEGLYRNGEQLMYFLNDARSTGLVFCNKLWILTGKEFLVYDGESVKHVHDIATVPQVLSQADENLQNGYTYQPFNMLTTRRKIGISLPEEGTKAICIHQNADRDSLKIYYKNTGADVEGYTLVWRYDTPEDERYLSIEFEEEIYPTMTGDEIIVEYQLDRLEEEIIEKCTFMASFDNRLFVGGNPDYPNVDFYSELNDGAYFSDISYTNIGSAFEKKDGEYQRIGTGGNRIVGYSYVGPYLGVHKDGEGEGATLFLRCAESTESGTMYPIIEGFNGEGALSPFANASLTDDPLFLTRSGIYAVATSDITRERSIRARSTRVNPRLVNEENLKDAVACTWRGFYLLFVNGNVYVADSRQKSYARNISGDFEYEWYFWDNIPARVVISCDDTVYFGDADGNVYRLNNDMIDRRGGYLMAAYNDDGAPIRARWSTKMDDDNDFSINKIMRRRGGGVYVKSYGAGDIKLSVRTERDFGRDNNFKKIGIFNFNDMDFANFTFNTLPFSFVPFSRKVKDYRMIQVIVENDKLNQCMGVVAIEWNYTCGGFAK